MGDAQNIFNHFKLEGKVPISTVEKYKGRIPSEVVDIWKQYGFGSVLQGYLKIVNPDKFQDLLEDVIYDIKKPFRCSLHQWEI
ncbi:hypothetical protein PthBH41_04710 [Parageobacillus thermoglucosidasius]|nr:hypothetical protein PthBH41_04710 [Parageobacillus thermoglucosidasius]GAJ43833.1 hypothetical protein GT2_13_00110 [Parageobacillus thermoglucosidasius NBRC 107763]